MILRSWWLYVGLIGFLGYVPLFPGELRLLNLFMLTPLVLRFVRRLTRPPQEQSKPAPPLPPSSGGAGLFTVRVLLSQMLMLVVPSMLYQIIRQSWGQIAAHLRAVDSPARYQQKVRYRLPFDGEWYTFNGGTTPTTSHSWDIVGQRFAYDWVVADDSLRRWRTDGRAAADYLCYDLPILAPADGEVAAVVEGVRDAPGPGTGWLDVLTAHFPGNAVTIRHAEGEYSFLAHLRPGSICVRVGDRVKQGQEIGRCGNSGHSAEPHLHFHVQDCADFFKAAGLPVAFDRVMVDGSAPADGVYICQGTRVQHTG
jgi:hypothetical protein